MSSTLWYSRYLPAFLLALLVAPAPARANGIFGDLLHKTVGTVINNINRVKNQVNAVARAAPTTAPSGQPVPTQAVAGSSGSAPQNPNAVPLVREFQPIMPSYSGAAEDLLGVRLGMTLAQAEKIASQHYPGNPVVQRARYSLAYKEVTVYSRPFIQWVEYMKDTPDTTDQLLLGFNSPIGDNRVVSMQRVIEFTPHATDEPLVSSIQAGLFKKYGTPSGKNLFLGIDFWWAYSQTSQLPCENGGCFNRWLKNGVGAALGQRKPVLRADGGGIPLSFTYGSIGSVSPTDDFKIAVSQQCGANMTGVSNTLSADDVVKIWASIRQNPSDSSKASQVELALYYSKPCADDVLDAKKQMQAAALERYHAISKAPAAPTF